MCNGGSFVPPCRACAAPTIWRDSIRFVGSTYADSNANCLAMCRPDYFLTVLARGGYATAAVPLSSIAACQPCAENQVATAQPQLSHSFATAQPQLNHSLATA